MDDLTNQAIDIVKKKTTPYITGILVFNIVLFLMLLYLVIKVSGIKQASQAFNT